MKEYLFKICLTCTLFIAFKHSFSQGNKELPPGYYIVIAAYAETREDMALLYVDKLKAKGYKAEYGFNKSRNFYFVYLNYFADLKASVRDMTELRKKGIFTDAWVRVIGVAGDIKPDLATSSKPETKSAAETPRETKSTDNKQAVTEPSIPAGQQQELVLPSRRDSVYTNPKVNSVEAAIVEPEPEKERAPNEPMTLGNTKIFLSLFNGTNNRIVDGEVQIIEPVQGKLIQRLKGNEYITLPEPNNSSKRLSLIADIFGYRKIQHELHYQNPLQDTIQPYFELVGNTFIAYFDLVRYRRGDIITLYNVYFYNDAAMMLPESKFELNNMVQLMQENPNYRIRFHGHSNGNYHGKIISPKSENLFSINGDVTEGIGSAKELSAKRAQTIKQYLVTNGIDASRMEIKAWGGKRPIYDRNSVNAKRNIRVEVEILQD